MSATTAGKKSRDAAQQRITTNLGALRMAGRLGWDRCSISPVSWIASGRPTAHHATPARCYAAVYDEDRWIGQPLYPVLIVEKDTLEPVCKPSRRRWQMPVRIVARLLVTEIAVRRSADAARPLRQDRAVRDHLFRLRSRPERPRSATGVGGDAGQFRRAHMQADRADDRAGADHEACPPSHRGEGSPTARAQSSSRSTASGAGRRICRPP